MKTRVYVEQSDILTKYYPQIQKSFLFWKYWTFVDYHGSLKECKAYCKVAEKYEVGTEEFAKGVCEWLQGWYSAQMKQREDDKKHRKTKKIYTYEWPW